jgi:hypothetical protein
MIADMKLKSHRKSVEKAWVMYQERPRFFGGRNSEIPRQGINEILRRKQRGIRLRGIKALTVHSITKAGANYPAFVVILKR